jgi:hypothetical protein
MAVPVCLWWIGGGVSAVSVDVPPAEEAWRPSRALPGVQLQTKGVE